MFLFNQQAITTGLGRTDTVQPLSVDCLAAHFDCHVRRPARQSLQHMQRELFTVRSGRGLQVQAFIGAGQAHLTCGREHMFRESRGDIAFVQVFGLLMAGGVAEQVFDNTEGQLIGAFVQHVHMWVSAFLLFFVERLEQFRHTRLGMGANFFGQGQHALLNDRVVLAEQLLSLRPVQSHQQRSQQAAITGLFTRKPDPGKLAAQISPVLGQGIALRIHHLQDFIARPARQALQQ